MNKIANIIWYLLENGETIIDTGSKVLDVGQSGYNAIQAYNDPDLSTEQRVCIISSNLLYGGLTAKELKDSYHGKKDLNITFYRDVAKGARDVTVAVVNGADQREVLLMVVGKITVAYRHHYENLIQVECGSFDVVTEITKDIDIRNATIEKDGTIVCAVKNSKLNPLEWLEKGLFSATPIRTSVCAMGDNVLEHLRNKGKTQGDRAREVVNKMNRAVKNKASVEFSGGNCKVRISASDKDLRVQMGRLDFIRILGYLENINTASHNLQWLFGRRAGGVEGGGGNGGGDGGNGGGHGGVHMPPPPRHDHPHDDDSDDDDKDGGSGRGINTNRGDPTHQAHIPHGTGKYSYANGDTYEGQFKDGKMEGFGEYKSKDGKTYKGQWKGGMKNGHGVLTSKHELHYDGKTCIHESERIYDGHWKDNFWDGYGVLTWNERDYDENKTCIYETQCVYDGQWKNMLKEGDGAYRWANGDIYIGHWEDGFRTGPGRYISNNGDLHLGMWKLDKRNGNGMFIPCDADISKIAVENWSDDTKTSQLTPNTLALESGVKYVGDCKNHKTPHGIGKFIFKNGDVYLGEVQNGKKQGWGIYKMVESGDRYEGYWKNDLIEGHGLYIWKGGNTYDGNWKEGKRDGMGVFKWKEGGFYMGDWKENKMNGQGILSSKEGTIYEGKWKDDKKVSDYA